MQNIKVEAYGIQSNDIGADDKTTPSDVWKVIVNQAPSKDKTGDCLLYTSDKSVDLSNICYTDRKKSFKTLFGVFQPKGRMEKSVSYTHL